MKPIFYTLSSNRPIMIIPDSQVHHNGHEVITYSYSIFIDKQNEEPLQKPIQKNSLHLANSDDPDYLGYIAFEQPGRVYNYVSNGNKRLSTFEIQQTVEFLNHFRESPLLWNISDLG